MNDKILLNKLLATIDLILEFLNNIEDGIRFINLNKKDLPKDL